MDSHELISMESDRVTCIIVASILYSIKDLDVVENSRKSGPAFYQRSTQNQGNYMYIVCITNV